jgi:hypothetical protein
MRKDEDAGNYVIVAYTMAKDERHIGEWVYHCVVHFGIDHVFIYDDESSVPIEDTLARLPSEVRARCTVSRIQSNFFDEPTFRGSRHFDESLYEGSRGKQHYFMELFSRHELPGLLGALGVDDDSRAWVFFGDCDEFLWSRGDAPDGGYVLRSVLSETTGNGVYINWLMYGTSFHADDPPSGPLVLNYPCHSPELHRTHGKSIVRVSRLRHYMDLGRVNCAHVLFRGAPGWGVRLLYNEGAEGAPIDSRCPLHLAHYCKLGVRTYIKRKLMRYDVAAKIHTQNYDPLSFWILLLSSRDAAVASGLMLKYGTGELLDLAGGSASYAGADFVTDDAGRLVHSMSTPTNHALLSRDSVILPCPKNVGLRKVNYGEDGRPQASNADVVGAYDMLTSLVDDEGLRYCTWGEILPCDFDVSTYKSLNADVASMSDGDAMHHFLFHGDGRRYTRDGET